jgi:hypothetical protein
MYAPLCFCNYGIQVYKNPNPKGKKGIEINIDIVIESQLTLIEESPVVSLIGTCTSLIRKAKFF